MCPQREVSDTQTSQQSNTPEQLSHDNTDEGEQRAANNDKALTDRDSGAGSHIVLELVSELKHQGKLS
jgi:hypothetical protein